MRYAARRDRNEPELVKLARRLGALIVYEGPLDFWCGHKGRWVPVEVKTPRGSLTLLEKQFMSHAALDKLPAVIWRSEADVLSHLIEPL